MCSRIPTGNEDRDTLAWGWALGLCMRGERYGEEGELPLAILHPAERQRLMILAVIRGLLHFGRI